MRDRAVHRDTLTVTAGRPPRVPDGPVNPPLELSSTFIGADGSAGPRVYARSANRSWEGAEEVLAGLEGGASATLFASGMAAVSAVLEQVPVGGRVVAPRSAYNSVVEVLDELHDAGRIVREVVDVADTAAVTAALDAAPTDLLWLESPTNPLLEVADLPACIAAAHAVGALTAVDNTFATPLLQRPLELGADLVVHSVSKALAGHSDVILGAVVASTDELTERLQRHRRLHGAIPGPFEAWLALRGMRTLSLRVERAQDNAGELARRLLAHPAIDRVRYPGLPDDPGHERARIQMDGYGTMLSVEPVARDEADAAERAAAVVAALRLWVPATSLGGVESLIERRRRHTNEPATTPAGLLRLSTGVEHVEDLWADLAAALTTSNP